MQTYSELKTQAEALMAQAEQIRKKGRASAIADIQAKMLEHGLTVEDLGAAKRKPADSKPIRPPKYQGPNGELWAGGPGRKPEWAKAAIAAGELEKYLIA